VPAHLQTRNGGRNGQLGPITNNQRVARDGAFAGRLSVAIHHELIDHTGPCIECRVCSVARRLAHLAPQLQRTADCRWRMQWPASAEVRYGAAPLTLVGLGRPRPRGQCSKHVHERIDEGFAGAHSTGRRGCHPAGLLSSDEGPQRVLRRERTCAGPGPLNDPTTSRWEAAPAPGDLAGEPAKARPQRAIADPIGLPTSTSRRVCGPGFVRSAVDGTVTGSLSDRSAGWSAVSLWYDSPLASARAPQEAVDPFGLQAAGVGTPVACTSHSNAQAGKGVINPAAAVPRLAVTRSSARRIRRWQAAGSPALIAQHQFAHLAS